MIKNKKGFTLVELLAVIVILAIILVIAVPQIMKTIDSARNGAFSASAKLVATSAEKEYLARKTIGDTSFEGLDTIPCTDVVKENTNDYQSCDISFDENGKATVTLIGKGKFAGKYICNGNKTTAEVSENACSGGGNNTSSGDNLKSYIETLAANTATANTHGLVTIDHTVGGTKTIPSGEASNTSIRYAGANPQNYVGFGACSETEIQTNPSGCELWRIIGIIDGKVKLVKKDSLGSRRYDYNNGAGYDNIWITTEGVKADINSYLNGQYVLPPGLSNLVAESTWYLGGYNTADISNNEIYIYERGNNVYSNTAAVYENTKVGLIYASDYAYATKSAECTSTINKYNTQRACTTNNWIYQDQGSSKYQWLITPFTDNSTGAFDVDSSGYVSNVSVSSVDQVRPSVYLNSNVLKTGGSGTSGSPYTLGLSS